MRFRILLSLSLSLVLISGAAWYRLSANTAISKLVSINSESSSALAVNIDDYTGGDEPKDPSAPAETLTKTDLVSRQLISDYINLAASGQATTDNLNSLVSRYVESVPNLAESPTVNVASVKIVPDNKANFSAYYDSITGIQTDHIDKRNSAYSGSGDITLGSDIYSVAKKLATTYEDSAGKIESTPVPTSLASVHIKLINNYLSSAAAMTAVSNTDKDSAGSLASLLTFDKNLEQEAAIITSMNRILNENGL